MPYQYVVGLEADIKAADANRLTPAQLDIILVEHRPYGERTPELIRGLRYLVYDRTKHRKELWDREELYAPSFLALLGAVERLAWAYPPDPTKYCLNAIIRETTCDLEPVLFTQPLC